MGVFGGSRKKKDPEEGPVQLQAEVKGTPPANVLQGPGFNRGALVDRIVTRYVDVAIGKPEMLKRHRERIRDHWAAEQKKNPKLTLHAFQQAYDLGCLLASEAMQFALGVVDTLHPAPPLPLANPGDAKPPADEELKPHVGQLDPAPAEAAAG